MTNGFSVPPVVGTAEDAPGLREVGYWCLELALGGAERKTVRKRESERERERKREFGAGRGESCHDDNSPHQAPSPDVDLARARPRSEVRWHAVIGVLTRLEILFIQLLA
jgi:hypothetical protein